MAEFERKNRSLKERYEYHKTLANKGKDLDGNTLTTAQRVYHANRANEILEEMNIFMKGVNFGKKISCPDKKSKGKKN